MTASRRLVGILVATVALVAACSSTGSAATSLPAAGPTPITIGVATSASLGQILIGANGMTLYTHAGDTATSSTCTGGCETAWPPLFLTGGAQAVLATGVTGTLASFARADGLGTQVTFNGMPLYYWQGDKTAGDTTGQNKAGFTVASPSGTSSGGGTSPAPTYTRAGY